MISVGGLGWGGLAQLRNYRPTFDYRLIMSTYRGGGGDKCGRTGVGGTSPAAKLSPHI